MLKCTDDKTRLTCEDLCYWCKEPVGRCYTCEGDEVKVALAYLGIEMHPDRCLDGIAKDGEGHIYCLKDCLEAKGEWAALGIFELGV